MLLMDEFAIARPRFIVAFGAFVRLKLERLPGFKQKPEEERLHWGVLPVGNTDAYVFMLDHPRAVGFWPASHASLATCLRRHAPELL